MARSLFLHIGMPKCATTTVQYYMLKNADWLKKQGLSYEKYPRENTNHYGNGTFLDTVIKQGNREDIRTMLDYFMRGDDNVMISSEALFSSARHKLFLGELDRLAADNIRIQVIIYFRRQDLWLESDYKQHIKSQSPWTRNIQGLQQHRQRQQTLDYYKTASFWASRVGKDCLHIVPLNKGQSRSYAVDRLLEIVNINPEGPARPEIEAHNISPPAGLIEAMRHLKTVYLEQGYEPGEVEKFLVWFVQDAQKLNIVPERKFILPQKRRIAIMERFEESNWKLAQEFLGDNPPFDPISEEPEIIEIAAFEEAAKVLAKYQILRPRLKQDTNESASRIFERLQLSFKRLRPTARVIGRKRN